MKNVNKIPIWFMRQAGRYLPEYMKIRSKNSDFLKLCLNPDLASRISLQPIRRFDIDFIILFSDILVIPYALGQNVHFLKNHGPSLNPINSKTELQYRSLNKCLDKIYNIFETIKILNSKKGTKNLIGFCGGPFTVLNYMVDPQAKYYTDNTWNNITERVQKLMGKVVAIDTSEANFAAKGLVYDPILENFVMGSNGTIDEYSAHRDDDAPLVMRGVGGGSRKAIVRCWETDRTFYTIDTGYFGNFKNKWLHRVTKNNLQYTGPIIDRPMDRAKKHGYRYRKFVPGRKILLCPPSDKVMNLFKQPTPQQWVENVKVELKKYTDRPIEVRLKPNRSERVSTNTIQAALNDDVHCLITYNSIAAVEALMEGKPAIVLGSNAASTIAETKLHRIEHLELPGREEVEAFFAHLAYCQFDVNELRSGFAWRTVNETASGKLPQWNSKNK